MHDCHLINENVLTLADNYVELARNAMWLHTVWSNGFPIQCFFLSLVIL